MPLTAIRLGVQRLLPLFELEGGGGGDSYPEPACSAAVSRNPKYSTF